MIIKTNNKLMQHLQIYKKCYYKKTLLASAASNNDDDAHFQLS
jgi:hypothetical protein